MPCKNIFFTVKIGNSPCDFEDSVVCTGWKAESLHGTPEYPFAILVKTAILLYRPRSYVRIGINSFRFPVTEFLDFTRPVNSYLNIPRSFTISGSIAEITIVYGGNLDMNINPVENRAGDFCHIPLYSNRAARALVSRVGEIAAGARMLYTILKNTKDSFIQVFIHYQLTSLSTCLSIIIHTTQEILVKKLESTEWMLD